MTDEILAVLVIDITDPVWFVERFGEDAVAQALSDIGAASDELISRLLIQHEILRRTRRDSQGRWWVSFRVLAGGMSRNTRETCAAIEAAGGKLLRDLLISLFGTATGKRVPAVLAVFPLPPDAPAMEDSQQWLDRQLATRPTAARVDVADAVEVASIIAGRAVRTLLQPIVRLSDRAVVGYEALSRGPQGSPLERPDRLFDAAHASGCAVEIELLCAELALERTQGRLPSDSFLTINLGPEALARAADALPLSGRREVLFELTEHLPLDEVARLTDAVARLRALGVGLALDDTGCGFADLDTARALRPEIVKLCITVIRNAGQGSAFNAAISDTAQHLRQLGCRVLAEGVETEAQHTALTACHIGLGQGWLYGRPEPVEDVLADRLD